MYLTWAISGQILVVSFVSNLSTDLVNSLNQMIRLFYSKGQNQLQYSIGVIPTCSMLQFHYCVSTPARKQVLLKPGILWGSDLQVPYCIPQLIPAITSRDLPWLLPNSQNHKINNQPQPTNLTNHQHLTLRQLS